MDLRRWNSLSRAEQLVLKAQTPPRNDDELYEYIKNVWGVVLPRTAHCPNCTAPFKVFADAYFARYPMIILKASRGSGKGLPMDAPILTPKGWVANKDLALFDQVIDMSGNIVNVIGIYPQGLKDVYKVSFNDGTSVICDDSHLWTVNTKENKKWQVKNVLELKDDLYVGVKRPELKWRIPVVEPINFSEKNLPIDPYSLGLLLGDGSIVQGTPRYTCHDDDKELVDHLNKELAYLGVSAVSSPKINSKCTDYYLSKGPLGKGSPNLLKEALEGLNLFGTDSHTKFIPKEYLFSSPEQRLALLQGIMDTDGAAGSRAGVDYVTASKKLFNDVVFLVQSLGGTAVKVKDKVVNGSTYYRAYIKMPLCPFRLVRKALKWKAPSKYPVTRIITAIDYIGKEETQCIRVDSPSSTFVTNDCIVTHNSVLLGLLSLVEQVTLNNYVMILGASEVQSKVVFNYISQRSNRFPGKFWDYKNAPKALQEESEERVGQSRIITGGMIRCSAASPTSIYGQRPIRLRMDEIDLMDEELIDGAIACCHPYENIKAQIILSSTSYKNDGTMNKLIERAEERNRESIAEGGEVVIPVYSFCYKDVLQTNNPDGYLTPELLANMKKMVSKEQWERQFENGMPILDECVFTPEELLNLFDDDLLGKTDKGEPVVKNGDPREVIYIKSDYWDKAEYFYHGADFGDRVDWTVFSSFAIPFDKTKPDVLFRFAKYGRWGLTKSISEYDVLLQSHEGTASHDGTGIGQIVSEQIEESSYEVKWTRQNKEKGLNSLIEDIKEGKVKFPRIKALEKAFKTLTHEHVIGKKHLPDEVASVLMAWDARSRIYLEDGFYGGSW